MANNDDKKIVQKDYEILKSRYSELNFIKGVTIYKDDTATLRRISEYYKNVTEWAEEYCNQHSIEADKFKKFVHKVQQHIFKGLEDNNSTFLKIELPSELPDELREIKRWTGAGSSYSYQECIRLITSFCRPKSNMSLVTDDEWFLMDKNFMFVDRFYFKIQLTNYGLFRTETRELNYDYYYPGNIYLHVSSKLWDFEGNFTDEITFKNLLRILHNRTDCKSEQDYFNMPIDIERGRFKIVTNKNNVWHEKDGEYDLEFYVERDDGLYFYTEEYTQPRTDTYREVQYVKDKENNSMSLNDFYNGLIMLKNGKSYLDAISVAK